MRPTDSARLGVIAAAAVLLGVSIPPTAGADPGFPDLEQFTEVDAAPYSRPFSYDERWANVYSFFTTPDGLSCAIGPGTWCTGDIPGLPGTDAGACTSVHQTGDDQRFTFSTEDQACEPATDPVLRPGEKLTDWLTGTTCVVGAEQLTACITADDRGFVLRPSGSRVF